jgi:hypothetical protein
MTHGKVIDHEERPIINGENSACVAEIHQAEVQQEGEGLMGKASSMLGSAKEKIIHAFDNVKDAFHKTESTTEEKGKNL